ncbi:MAG: hypothetical protein ACFCGT_20940 [Sandaracinaceae bacterium]
MSRLGPCLLGLAAVLAGGCAHTRFVEIRHPLQVGQVDPNAVPFENTSQERETGLPPGTLVDQATLTEVTPERVCADVTLWSLQTNRARGAYQNYRIALLTDQQGVEQTQAEIQLEQATLTRIQGHRAVRVPAGRERYCYRNRRGRCIEWRWRTVYATEYQPHIWEVQTNPAEVCFPNGGFVTPSTSRAAIEFRPVNSASRFVFEWVFTSAVAGGT